MKIAFDCDGTLIDLNDKPRAEIIAILEALKSAGHEIVVWSGGGKFYADSIVRKLRIENVATEGKPLHETHTNKTVDIAFDDMDVKIGRVNIKV